MPPEIDDDHSDYNPIGYISHERLQGIPPEYHGRHEFLIYLFQQIQDLILNTQDNAIRGYSFTVDENIDLEALKEDPVKYAAMNLPQAKDPTVNDISLALMADFLEFTHTSFAAFERRLFAPGYANLRKPLQENLLLLMWICADDEDFLRRFLNDPSKDFKQMESDAKLRSEIYEKASSSGVSSRFDFSTIEKMIYDKSFDNGLACPMTKAIHLYTGHHALRTEDMNFNWIFKNRQENDVYDTGYYGIAIVYLHVYEIIYHVCHRIAEPTKNLKAWLDVVLWSCFEAIFIKDYPATFKLFAEQLSHHLRCMHCAEKFEFNVENLPRFLMMEQITCASCGEHQNFPLYWLFCHKSYDDMETSGSA